MRYGDSFWYGLLRRGR